MYLVSSLYAAQACLVEQLSLNTRENSSKNKMFKSLLKKFW